MKRILMLLCSLLISLNIAADGHITEIQKLIDDGDYETAKRKITHYQKVYPKEFTEDVVAFWMQKCDEGIDNKKRKEKIQADKAKARKEKEERLQKEEARKQNKLVYISAEATTIGGKEYAGMSSAIKADGIKFTDTKEDAYWSVHITAEVKDHHTKENDYNGKKMKKYYSTVVAYLTIVNNITDSIIHQEEIRKESNSTQDYERAVNTAYQDINKKIWNKIQELCK